jgi:hypothetical protein
MATMVTRKAPPCKFFVEMIVSDEEHRQIVDYLLTDAVSGFFNHRSINHSQEYVSRGGVIRVENILRRFTYGFSDENAAFDVRMRFTK